jgi:hypothetical protein
VTDLMLIVVGAHLRAEMADRPLAYQLKQRIDQWLDRHRRGMNISLTPVVCSDIWYVNNEPLQSRPTISIGGPGVNGLSAYFRQKLHDAMVRENQIVIQLDPEFTDLRVSVWGMDHALTVEAMDLFMTRFLESYLRAVLTQVEPQE